MDYVSQLNQRQRILVVFAASIVLMTLFPPFYLVDPRDHSETLRYGFVGDPPHRGRHGAWATATVAYGMLLMQYIGATLVARASWVFVHEEERRRAAADSDARDEDECPRVSR